MSLILIVENSPQMADAALKALEGAGHECHVALGASEAFSKAQEQTPDLALLESPLQDGDAPALVERLKKLRPELQIVVTAGLGNEELAARVFPAGACAYVVKDAAYLTRLPALVSEAIEKKNERRLQSEKDLQARRLEAQNELSAWMAHNFKNILSAAVGYLRLIDFKNEGQTREKREEFLGESLESLMRALGLLSQLEEMTRGGAGEAEETVVAEEVEAAWERVNMKMRRVLQEKSEEEAARFAARKSRTTFLNAATMLPPQFLVRRDLGSILEALLQNAIEATVQVEVPRILAHGEISGDYLILTISDNGRGMDEKSLRHALDPLFSTKGEVGVGLSLSLVQSLVTRHGGELSLESTLGKGATARFTWKI